MPPFHAEYQPMEGVWATLKQRIAKPCASAGSVEAMVAILGSAVESLTPAEVHACYTQAVAAEAVGRTVIASQEAADADERARVRGGGEEEVHGGGEDEELEVDLLQGLLTAGAASSRTAATTTYLHSAPASASASASAPASASASASMSASSAAAAVAAATAAATVAQAEAQAKAQAAAAAKSAT